MGCSKKIRWMASQLVTSTPMAPSTSPMRPNICSGRVEYRSRYFTVIRSRMTRTVRDRPYFDTPSVRGRWLTTISDTRTPISLAMAGMKRCISPYSRRGLTTSARKAFREQP